MNRIRRRIWLAGSAIAVAGSLTSPVLLAQVAPGPPPGGAVVTGRVLGPASAPIVSATVAIVPLHLGATTNADGRFSFTVPAAMATGARVPITVREIGYKEVTDTIALGPGTIAHNFVLAVNPLKLNEVVVTGEGTTARVAELAVPRANVSDSAIQKSFEPNITTALEAKAPGVEITSTAGDPGASTKIVIRGINTLGGGGDKPSQPLFVVDGVPVDNSSVTPSFLDPQASAEGGAASPNRAVDINPDDIENVEILKGAAAGSIYGARAGQGVVLITTKHGRAGQTRYSLNSSVSLDNPRGYPSYQTLYGQGSGGVADPCALGQGGLDCYANPGSWGPRLAAGTPVFNHPSEAYVQGNTIDNTLTASGGSDRTQFYISGSYLDQRGSVIGPNNYLKRSSVRLSADHQVFSNLRIGGNVSFAETNQGGVQKGYNFSSIPWTSDLTPPNFDNHPYLDPATGLQRSYIYPFPSNASADNSRGFDNPFWSAMTAQSTSTDPRTFGDVHAQYDALSWLKLTYSFGVDNSGDSRLQGQGQGNSNSLFPGGQVITLGERHNQVNQDVVATATMSRGDNLQNTFSLGNNLNSANTYDAGQVGDVLLTPGLYSLNNVLSARPPYSLEQHQRVIGFFGQDRLDLYQQLYLQAGLRYDGASTFSSGNLWAWFPSASAAWEFTKVTGPIGPISYGKVRAAYGEVGTEPAPYLYESIYSSTRSFTNGYGGLFDSPQGLGGLTTPATAPAINLRPERTGEAEGGVDLTLFGDLADLNFTVYRRLSTQVILATPEAASGGYTLRFSNGASIQNQGGELGINVRPISNRDVDWSLSAQGSVNHNRVNSLLGAPFVSYGGSGGFTIVYSQLGNAVDAFRDYDYVRCGRGITLYQNGAPYGVDAHCSSRQRSSHALFINDGTLANSAGDPGDGAGFPLLDPTSRLIGNPEPKWMAGLSSQFRFRRFTFSALVDIRHGGLVYNGTHAVMNFYGTSGESGLRGHSVVFGTSYMPGGGQKGSVAGPGAGKSVNLDQNWFQSYDGGISPSPIGAPFYEDGSFTKLREVSVSYLFSGPLVTKLGLSTITARISGRNLLVFTGYTGTDPEVNAVGAETGANGIDFFGNPQTRSVVFSLQLTR